MPLILGTNSIKDTGYDVANSLRFNSGSSDSLTKTPSSAGNRKTWTFSTWVKRSILTSGDQAMFDAYTSSTDQVQLFFVSDDDLILSVRVANYGANLRTNAKFRDNSAWLHIVVAVDTTQGTASNRMKLYINGVQEISFSEAGYPNQNVDTAVNNTVLHRVGDSNLEDFFNGYMSEVCLIDGQALDPTSFGEFDEDSGIWKPIDVSGLTFGTNGFYLDFEDSSALGNDVSGNNNDFTVNNLTAIDQSTDTCTNNFATWNSLDNFYQSNTYSEGNLQVQTQNTSFTYNFATIGVSTGKWYWEVEYDAKSGGTDQPFVGITSTQPTSNDHELGNFPNDFAWYTDNGTGYLSNNNTYSNVGFNAYTVGDVISVALDLDNNKLYFAKNGTWEKSGNPESGSTGTGAISITATASTPLGAYFPSVADGTTSYNATFKANFGSPPYAISSGNTDGNGYGNFEYAVPSGYYSLNSKNLAEYG